VFNAANLSTAIFDGTTILAGAQLRGANLTNAQLPGANLAGATLEYTNFTGANLQGANLTGAALRGSGTYTLFTNANLRNANLTNTNLAYYQKFGGADLRCANTTGVVTAAPTQVLWIEGALSATCPDGTLASAHGNTCVGYLTTGALACPLP
jgi:uncharacterized protein YjbI with pentapeptide repeats